MADRILDRLHARADRLGSFGAYCAERFAKDRCMNVAASLSYTTLLSIVPLVTIAFAILAAFPAFDSVRQKIQGFVFQNFVASSGAAVQQHIERFTENTGQLTAVGVAVLAVTALLLLNTIEASFNEIWRVARKRALALRFVIYWAVLTLAPLFLGASIAVSSYVFTFSTPSGDDGVSAGAAPVLRILAIVLVVVGLAVVYKFLPNRRVKVRDAFLGAAIGAVLFELLKAGFGLYVANFPSYQTIYGAISAIPLFLIWMYMAWCAVLFGAEVAAAGPEWRAHRFIGASGVDPGRERMALALATLGRFAEAGRTGASLSLNRLADAVGAPPERVEILLGRLERARFVAHADAGGWVLSRDLDEATLYDLYVGLGLGVGGSANAKMASDRDRSISHVLDELDQAERNAMSAPLKPVVARPDAGADKTERRAS